MKDLEISVNGNYAERHVKPLRVPPQDLVPVGVHLVQERLNLTSELANKDAAVDLAALEEGFTKAAKNYSERKGITYAAWREAGVDAAVLRKAGIRRGVGDA